MNNIQISKQITDKIKAEHKDDAIVSEFKPYAIVNDEVIIYNGTFKNGNPKYKKLGIHNIGPDGVLCNDMETYITWDKF